MIYSYSQLFRNNDEKCIQERGGEKKTFPNVEQRDLHCFETRVWSHLHWMRFGEKVHFGTVLKTRGISGATPMQTLMKVLNSQLHVKELVLI